MKNFVVRSLCRIEKFGDNAAEQVFVDRFEHYQRMQALSIESFQRNLQGDWQLIQLEQSQPSLQKSFQHTLQQIHELAHKQAPCNIMYTDPDTLCLIPFMPWGQISAFTMFPNTEQSYYNGGVKYFPSDLDEDFWGHMLDLMQTWDETVYDTEQEICKKLMIAQRIKPKAMPWAVAQGPINRENVQEYFRMNRCIWHFHSSRDPLATAELMHEVWQHYRFN